MGNYLTLLDEVVRLGIPHNDRTGVGTYSRFGELYKHNMEDGFPLLTTKYVNFNAVIAELLWFVSGSTNLEDLDCSIWDEWGTKEQCEKFGRNAGDMGPVYGALWRRYPVGDYSDDKTMEFVKECAPPSTLNGIDQLKQLIDDINTNPNSRRLIVNAWHPYWAKKVTLPPCHTMFQIKCYPDNKLMSMHMHARSIDIFLGLPFNIASYALLLHMIASVTGYNPHVLSISFSDLHLYTNHLKQAKLQLTREPYIMPRLNMHKRESLFDFVATDFSITHYNHHPAIKAEVAV